ncbi:MAG TPA: type VI secretion system tube protein Hcp [Vicinamibacterales bacterium]|nr:type VI secretion system tube protein Hcp [Vicinamibacterales bacterium]
MPLSESVAARAPGAGDMFLSVNGARAGAIAGEAQDSSHKNEIEVLGWSWGMQGHRDLGGGGAATGKATIRELRVLKRVDKASTALMSALRTNEQIKATLTLRKAGKSPLEYLKISIEEGRVNSLEIEAGDVSGSSTLVERVSFTFNKISVEYTPQGQDGRALGGTTFVDQWTPS